MWLMSIVPIVTLLVGLHAIPVASPDLGVYRNVGALVRSAIGHSVLTVAWVFYMLLSIGAMRECRSLRTFVISALIGGLLPDGFWLPVTLLWRYPAPGGGIAKLFITLGCIFYLTRCCQTKEDRAMNRHRTRILSIVMAEYLLIVVFFLLLALAFSQAPWGIQLVLMLIQPPLRSLLKRQSWVHARKLSDLSSDVTLNFVDMSASMYQALCIQYARNPEIAALVVIGELFLGVAVARMYSAHTFVVDGNRTLQTAIKIVEGSLSSTLVIEEDETQKEDTLDSDETFVPHPTPVEEITSTHVQEVEIPSSTQRLRRASSDTVTTRSQRSTRQRGAAISENDSQAFKCLPTVIHKVRRAVSDPFTGKFKSHPREAPRRHSTESNTIPLAHESLKPIHRLRRAASSGTTKESVSIRSQHQHRHSIESVTIPYREEVDDGLKFAQRFRRTASSGKVKEPGYGNAHRLHRRMTDMVFDSARSLEALEPSLSPKSIYLLRRTASDTIPENKVEREPAFRDASTGRSRGDARMQNWSRGPSKVYCFTDIRPDVAPSPPSPKHTKPSPARRSSTDLPPLGDLQSTDGFGRSPPLRRPTSVFLTPRTLMKSGSKRLLDLGRSNRGLTYTAGEEISEKNNPTECRRPTQVNIDGMLVVRKDQARILEQTLQLLFSCEVLVVPSSSRFLFLSCWVRRFHYPTQHSLTFLPIDSSIGLLLATLWTLPSARYSILLRGISSEEIVERMLWCLCFSLFELPALVIVCITVFKKYGISTVHLLAFLLEQQCANFQTKLVSCFIALVFSTSAHQGT
ncbi:hypothetical protein PR003_g13118 [Phytophthora rubi]|uniref:Cation/H+ exchanger domain-containing protein n=1 Tax=Phytophthora rubi TaxID=129364 RepID=A0A6A4EY92_9STRA|nr:hypothetical protein PR003_g13118 [Phytophthora rubi]